MVSVGREAQRGAHDEEREADAAVATPAEQSEPVAGGLPAGGGKAQPAEGAQPVEEPRVSVVRLRLGATRLLFDAASLDGAFALGEITPVPGLPGFMLGLVVSRARVFPLVDPRPILGLETLPAAPGYALLARAGAITLALAADAIEGPLWLPASELAPPGGRPPHQVPGAVAADGAHLVDVVRLLADARLTIDQPPPMPPKRQPEPGGP